MKLAFTLDSVSTHSRPKAAGKKTRCLLVWRGCFNTQPPEGGWHRVMREFMTRLKFQHTAARRRLAGRAINMMLQLGFNTQPPEGGWSNAHSSSWFRSHVSTHSRPKAAGRFSTTLHG